jgi:hypothetical protein
VILVDQSKKTWGDIILALFANHLSLQAFQRAAFMTDEREKDALCLSVI